MGDPESAVLWLIFAACIAVLCALAKRNLVAALLLASSIYPGDPRHTDGGVFRMHHGCGRRNGFVANFKFRL